jgi:hypothetical protein
MAGRTGVLSAILRRLGLARDELDAPVDTLPFWLPETILLSPRLAVQLKSVGRESVLSREALKNLFFSDFTLKLGICASVRI